jgi:hypothetical protein
MNFEKIPLQQDNFVIKNPKELREINNCKVHSKFGRRSLRVQAPPSDEQSKFENSRHTNLRASHRKTLAVNYNAIDHSRDFHFYGASNPEATPTRRPTFPSSIPITVTAPTTAIIYPCPTSEPLKSTVSPLSSLPSLRLPTPLQSTLPLQTSLQLPTPVHSKSLIC